jgi:hypothetical protein
MKFLLLIFFYVLSSYAQSPWYYGAGKAVNLENAIQYKNGVKNIAGALDPSSVAVNAPAGSMYLSTSGTIYIKQDAGSSTNWLPLGIATPGSLTTINGQSGPAVNLVSGSAGTDFAINTAANVITFDIPSSSAANRGLLTSANWTTFNNKEPAITATTSADYYRGDKTFQPLNKAAVGLSNVDNTSDVNKPVSTATQTALDLKADLSLVSNVDNTSDATKNSASVTLLNKTIDADLNTITNIENADIKAGAAIDAAKIADGSVSTTEFQYINTLSSNAQTQINSKQSTITGGATSIVSSDLTASRALVSDGSGKVAVSATTATELGYVSGVTSGIQTQINAISASAPVAPLTKTTTYTVQCGDRDIFVDASAGSFTITLATASGCTDGIHQTIRRTDNTIANIVTISGTLSGGSSYKLHTQGETYEYVDAGSTWGLLKHETDTAEFAFPSVAAGTLITGTTTNPSYGNSGSPVTNAAYWYRHGDRVHIRWDYRTSNTTGAGAGSGTYLFNVPSQLAAASSVIVNTAIGSTMGSGCDSASIGSFRGAYNTLSDMIGQVCAYSTTQFKAYIISGVTDIWGSGGFTFAQNANLSFSIEMDYPVNGWTK